MTFSIETGISAAAVFVQGLLSFFTPCVLPLVPLYLGYLASGLDLGNSGGKTDSEEKHTEVRTHARINLFVRVLCFSVGISGAFFVLGLGATAAGVFLRQWRNVFLLAGGILIVLFGLCQMGLFGSSSILNREHRFHVQIGKMTMSPVTAFLMGFTFSFAWTPCVGPALTSVLLMTGSAKTGARGLLLIAVYTAGFILPFLLSGIFTVQLLGFFRKHGNIVRYTVKAGGFLLVVMGVLMLSGIREDIFGRISGSPGRSVSEQTEDSTGNAGESEVTDASDESGEDAQENSTAAAFEFQLKDQYGREHSLSQYRGKVVFLNFWGTWCGPCRNEMPDIQKLYEEYAGQGDQAEVVILGAAAPGLGSEGSVEEITAFMEENGYTYPVLMDESAEMFTWYGISSFPTTFMIDREGNIFGYVSGQLTEEMMRSIIAQTLDADS